MKLVSEEIQIAGDKEIKDLTPQTTNLGERLVKNLRICGSGIYTYARSEAALLHLAPVPEKYKDLQFINVYRPADVLEKSKDLFARVPIITGHHVLVTPQNAKQLVVGMVGDSVDTEVDRDDGETYLYTTGTIVAGDGMEAYEKYGQLSVGYDPDIQWEEGEHNGIPYQAVLKGFHDVNHLLICKVARGGPQCMVMDSLDQFTPLERFNNKHGGAKMGIFNKIFASKEKKVAGDSAVPLLLQSIAVGADPAIQVQKIKDIVGDSNAEFTGFLDELAGAKGEEPAVIEKACNIVETFYRENMAGDQACPNCGKVACSCGDEPKDGKKPPKKEDPKPEAGDEPKGKSAGDEGIDYDLLATKVAEKLQPKQSAGDEGIDEDVTSEGLKALSAAIAGDESKSLGSDDIMKSIWG